MQTERLGSAAAFPDENDSVLVRSRFQGFNKFERMYIFISWKQTGSWPVTIIMVPPRTVTIPWMLQEPYLNQI